MTIEEYLAAGITPFHVVETSKKLLEEAGYEELALDQEWKLEDGKGYFVSPYPSSFYAFYTGSKDLRMMAGHTDSPVLKLKPSPTIPREEYRVANVEAYGGMILHTWFDRPLGLAGKLVLKGKDAFAPKVVLYDSKKLLAVVSSLAIHMDREVNKKNELKVQEHLLPLFTIEGGKEEGKDLLLSYVARDLGISYEEILDFDLIFYNPQKPEAVGLEGELLVSPRLDNLTSCYAGLEAMREKKPGGSTAVLALFDNEEVGSRSKQGADSSLLSMILDKMMLAMRESKTCSKISKEEIVTRGFFASMDVAHAWHHNYSGKSDLTTKTYLGQGLVLKSSGAQRYNSDSYSNGVILELCKENKIAVQRQINHSDVAGGTTLGPIVSSYLPVYGVDLGIGILGMHSACETGAKKDVEALVEWAKVYSK